MNDTELDQLLDSWETPGPPASLREDLRARFPRAERRKVGRPLGWVLAIAIASITLAIGVGQSGEHTSDFWIVRVVNQLYKDFLDGVEVWRSSSIVAQIRQSDPKVYVDGHLVAPLVYGRGSSMNVKVPEDGVYVITAYPMPSHRGDGGLTGWVEAGQIHGNLIEFWVGSKQVRIECNKPIVDSNRPVFAMRRP